VNGPGHLSSYQRQPKVPPSFMLVPLTSSSLRQPIEQPRPSDCNRPLEDIQWHWTEWQIPSDYVTRGVRITRVAKYFAQVAAFSEQTQLVEQAVLPRQIDVVQYYSPQAGRMFHDLFEVRELDQEYVFEDRSEVVSFIEQNQILKLLLEAQDPLNAAFGKDTIKKLALTENDEGFTTLFCLIAVTGDVQEARRALRSFDQQWWLANCDSVSGKLNFDFDLI
jgi:hypothetical protein